MKTLIIYDSFFGYTEKIAQSMVDRQPETILAIRVNAFKPEMLVGIDLLLIGSPTRGFMPSEAIIQLIKQLSNGEIKGIKTAAFDTRIEISTIKSKFLRFLVNKGGYAAKTIAKRMQKAGAILIAPPEGFIVIGEQGPLKEGELERAATWIKEIMNRQ